MNRSKSLLKTALLSGALIFSAGLAYAGDSAQPMSDSWITTKVKAELVKDKMTKARHIEVDTANGVVTLSGTVNSDDERAKAEQDARGVKGVTDVANNLTVGATK